MRRFAVASIAWLGVSPVARAAGPVGSVSADCSRVEGWAQDPDAPATTIDVHLYFDGPAGSPNAVGVPYTGNLQLAAGCAGEQCAHGFRATLPLSRLDGQPHVVHAYGIDATGDPNLELSGSPAMYTCPPLPIATGVKRHILSPLVLEQWKFSTYFDLMKVADLDLAAVPVGAPIGEPPQVVAAEGDPDLWLLDQGFRRQVAPEAAAAWRIDPASATPMPPAMLDAVPVGTPLSARPVLAQGTGPEVYLLDEHQCTPDDPNPACAQPDETTTGASEATTGPDSESTGADEVVTAGDTTPSDASGSEVGGDVTESDSGEATGESSATADPGAPEEQGESEGCGCSTTPRGGWALVLLALVRRRGRRRID